MLVKNGSVKRLLIAMMKKLESERATSSVVVCRSLAIAGKPGKYISILNGLSAVNVPNIRMRKK